MKHKIRNYFCGAIVGFINGFFASGGGIVAVLVLKRYMKLDETKAHSTAISVILPLTLCGIFVYGSGGYADVNMIIKTSIGGIIGAVIGAKLLKKSVVRDLALSFFCALRVDFFLILTYGGVVEDYSMR